MSRRRRKRNKRVEIDLLIPGIVAAFEAAMKLWDVWESPQGPAVVVDVATCSALNKDGERTEGFDGGWWVTYRVLKDWGKEAWNR